MDLPDKYQNLIIAQKAGINVPETLFLDEKTLLSGSFDELLNKFVDQCKSRDFIIRSAVQGEDGAENSLAGHFKSSRPTKPEEVKECVQHLFSENLILKDKYTPNGKVGLMIQPYFVQDCGGVCFSQWKYFKKHFVGEVSKQGADKAVEGLDSQFFCLALSNDFDDVLVPENMDLTPLKSVVKQCQAVFDFVMDIEWGMVDGVVTIFQIRPVTRSLQSLCPASESQLRAEQDQLASTGFTDWGYDGYAESLGVLSPPSFELIMDMYKGAQSTLRSLGFKADSVNFLTRLSNGQVYASRQAQRLFFDLQSWKTPFWQIFNEANFLAKVKDISAEVAPKKPFDRDRLQSLFNAWQIANFYAARKNLSTFTLPGEYELDQYLQIEVPVFKDLMTWPDWRNFFKQAWLLELNKLKKTYTAKPLGIFDGVADYQADLANSIFDFPAFIFETSGSDKKQTVVKGGMDLSKVFVVSHPKSFTGQFPDGCVLVSPYFNNDWVGVIDSFSGIILEQGGLMSHSAIVAREKSIPYVIGWDNAVKHFSS